MCERLISFRTRAEKLKSLTAVQAEEGKPPLLPDGYEERSDKDEQDKRPLGGPKP